jgi:predicted ABC-type transport system involved in lysophospholipase L1 biosynthesis ATPase subunit
LSLQVRNLVKSFAQGSEKLQILNGLQLQLKDHEIIAVVGQSGSGKSTLLSLLAGFIKPDSGQLLWREQDLTNWSANQWAEFRRKNLGFVFQSFHLIPYLTAAENVALPLRLLGDAHPDQKASALLTELGLSARLSHLPSQLSGGECQRVAIARALIHLPQLILADEPTGSLDVATGQQILDLFFSTLKARKQTALVVTHSAEVAARCDRILTMRQGQLWA